MTTKILRRFRLDWPLLGKELLEQAARKQMYVVRVVYALVLFGAFCVYYARHVAGGPVLAMGADWRHSVFWWRRNWSRSSCSCRR